MSTPYDNIHNRVIRKIQDRDLLSLTTISLEEILDDYLNSAITAFVNPKVDLSDRNDTTREFNPTLTDREEEILALYEVLGWLKPQINTIDLIKQNYSTKDYRLTSQANHTEKLILLYNESQKEADRLMIKYSYARTSLDDLV
ncbi:unnamed protein product [marine sediment metagenome]|uniref:Uncharacterized protein n=1 Tax=marine sediment metagenome TaxID=412755 RepID=X1C6C5_9ZZZZ